ncbi:hypothetical protein [Streptomyces sp. NPDC058268]|uniref:hypothetical protein n=1 Tax=Streptomyces sp. NPDC058268 TaxID=3346413 RepID=UPI0036E9C8E5
MTVRIWQPVPGEGPGTTGLFSDELSAVAHTAAPAGRPAGRPAAPGSPLETLTWQSPPSPDEEQ